MKKLSLDEFIVEHQIDIPNREPVSVAGYKPVEHPGGLAGREIRALPSVQIGQSHLKWPIRRGRPSSGGLAGARLGKINSDHQFRGIIADCLLRSGKGAGQGDERDHEEAGNEFVHG